MGVESVLSLRAWSFCHTSLEVKVGSCTSIVMVALL